MLENLFQAILIALVNISESEESKAQGHEAEDSRERSELYDVDDHEMTQTQGQDDRGGEAEATALGREAREQKDGPKNCPEGGGIVLSGIPGELSPEEERDEEEGGLEILPIIQKVLGLDQQKDGDDAGGGQYLTILTHYSGTIPFHFCYGLNESLWRF